MLDLQNCCSDESFPQYHGVSYYIAFVFKSLIKKVINLQIDVNKLIRKVLINLFCHAKFINKSASSLYNQQNYQSACFCLCP